MTHVEEHLLHGAEATRDLGLKLAARLRAGDLIELRGPLGAGKTTLAQGIARGLGVSEGVTSPTFVLMVEHEGTLPLLHLDAYRLEKRDGSPLDADDLQEAGIFDFLARRDAVKLIEWPERLAEWLPTPQWDVEIAAPDADSRRLVLTHHD